MATGDIFINEYVMTPTLSGETTGSINVKDISGGTGPYTISWYGPDKFPQNYTLNGDVTTFNVDFLSCDIDPQDKTFLALKKIINDGVRPKYIAFETDKYKENVDYSKLAEEFLKPYGYKIGVKNVYSNLKRNKIFETWFLQSNLNFKTIEYKTWINKIKW